MINYDDDIDDNNSNHNDVIQDKGGGGPSRLTSGSSGGREALFLPGCWSICRRLFVFVNPFHARHIRELQPNERITCR